MLTSITAVKNNQCVDTLIVEYPSLQYSKKWADRQHTAKMPLVTVWRAPDSYVLPIGESILA